MSKIHIDLETIPSQKPGELERIRNAIKPPGTISKKETIDKWYAESADIAAMEQYRKQSFDGLYGEIISIAWAIDDAAINVVYRKNEESEALLIKTFFDSITDLTDFHGNRIFISTWVGHYITGFDLRFLWQRCVVNGIRPSVPIPYDAKPWDSKVFDTKVAWTGLGNYSGAGKLNDIAKAFGLEGKGDLDGSKVYDYWLSGRIDEIAEYNMHDVEMCRAIYKRMNFLG
jgi:predicted PolB exonuclease-like 3'-5' exonuclease